MTEQFNPTDTKQLQLASLDAFAACLGYHRNGFPFSSPYTYYSTDLCNKHISDLSFNTMCRLHNHGILECSWIEDELVTNFNIYKRVTASAAKIVRRVKLQYDKRLKRVICQDSRIKFVYPDYEAIFLETGV